MSNFHIELSATELDVLYRAVGDALAAYRDAQHSAQLASVADAVHGLHQELLAVDASIRTQTGML